MKATFLAAGDVALGPPADDEREEAHPWVLASLGSGDDEVELAARVGGAHVGHARLERLDWRDRSARLALRWSGAPGAAADAAARLARYAFDELNLERVEAAPVGPAWESVLRQAGFVPRGPAWVRLRAPS